MLVGKKNKRVTIYIDINIVIDINHLVGRLMDMDDRLGKGVVIGTDT